MPDIKSALSERIAFLGTHFNLLLGSETVCDMSVPLKNDSGGQNLNSKFWDTRVTNTSFHMQMGDIT